MEPIGIIRTPYKTKQDCPIQPLYASAIPGSVEVFEKYTEGLLDIDTFSHLYLLYQFDRAGSVNLVRPTFLDDTPHGIYASRHPCRPNGIGLSIVKLIRRVGNNLIVEDVDMLDQTPLLDIKPYMPKYDAITDASEGWTDNKPWREKLKNRE
jgi:tRNA-Thr(GGU) m(6)t(6)A37 methyltransferase TsaA